MDEEERQKEIARYGGYTTQKLLTILRDIENAHQDIVKDGEYFSVLDEWSFHYNIIEEVLIERGAL